MPLRAETTSFTESASEFIADAIPALNLTIKDSSGVPIVLPLRDVRIKGSRANPTCIGGWDRNYWCDGDTRGWTDGDPTKTEEKACKRGPDGKVPPIGDACTSGDGCNNAWLFSATFSSYGVNITP